MTINARIEINSVREIDLFDIIIAYSIQESCDKLYFYIDDVDATYDQVMIDHNINVLVKCGIVPAKIVKSSEYYQIAWIYMHKLLQLRCVDMQCDKTNYSNELYITTRINTSITVTLLTDSYHPKSELNDDNNKRETVSIYNKGNFSRTFLLHIIDDAEKINYVTKNGITSEYINNKLKSVMVDVLKLNISKIVLSDLAHTIDFLRNTDHSKHITTKNINPIMFSKFDIKLNDIRNLIENKNISLDRYILPCHESINDTWIESPDIACFIKNPILMKLKTSKKISLKKRNYILSQNIFVDGDDICYTSNNKIRLKYAGGVIFDKSDGEYICEWKKRNNKKNKNKNKNTVNWIPCDNRNKLFKLNNTNILLFYPNELNNVKILKINNTHYVIDKINNELFKI